MTPFNALDLSDSARMRSGTAARLAGLPVTTLRVWERRYGVVAAPKTATGQRLYSGLDVQRLRLLKHLTDCGHAIGTVAGLSAEALDALMAQEGSLKLSGLLPDKASNEPTNTSTGLAARAHAEDSIGNLRVWVVGRGAAQKLEALAACELVAVHDDLDAAESASLQAFNAAPLAVPPTPQAELAPDVLVVHLASLMPGEADRVMALATRLSTGLAAPAVVVLYAFGRESLADTLRSAGATVRRDPISARELCALVTLVASQRSRNPDSATAQFNEHSTAAEVSYATAQPRQFDDANLAFLMGISTNVACECPRHVAEIVMQLANFERYSQDCMSRTPADADLHAHLTAVAASARTGFERALRRIMAAEGIVLPRRESAVR